MQPEASLSGHMLTHPGRGLKWDQITMDIFRCTTVSEYNCKQPLQVQPKTPPHLQMKMVHVAKKNKNNTWKSQSEDKVLILLVNKL